MKIRDIMFVMFLATLPSTMLYYGRRRYNEIMRIDRAWSERLDAQKLEAHRRIQAYISERQRELDDR